ncbi:hypothetical protein APHAL10511_006126 [Amanita phalloides]|nr:hypothetical protein APHAL10511_006126 [Amanita phalloides]
MSTPSFAPLPPSFTSFPDSAPGKSSKDEEENHVGRRHECIRKGTGSSKERKDRKASKRKERKRKDRLQDSKSVTGTVDRSSSKIPDNDESAWRPFYSDRRGDMLNIQFGGLHVGDVPKYHLVDGGRSILGLSGAWVARRSGKGIEVDVRGHRKLAALTDPGSRALLAAGPTRRLLPSGDAYKYEEIDGYLRLPSRGRDSDLPYRTITGPQPDSNADLTSESEHESESENSAEDEPILTSHQEMLKTLEHQLSQDPGSIKLWLSLLAQTVSSVPLSSKNATKVRAEISLSVLLRAMSANPGNTRSKTLRIQYLKAGEEIWHETKMHDEFEEALRLGGIDIWMEWLDWRIRRSRKGVNGIVEDAARAMSAFSADIAEELNRLRIFWRTTVAFRDSGYPERGMAMFQAQAELTFKSPQNLQGDSFDTLLESLEDFWESEVARVGEPGSTGWGTWAMSRKKQVIPPETNQPSQSAKRELDPYRQWAANEIFANDAPLLPNRTTDGRPDSDPYSIVLFADIRPFLFSLQTPKARDLFRLAWLSFIGLTVPGFFRSLSRVQEGAMGADWDDRWCCIHLCRLPYLNAILPEVPDMRTVKSDAVAGTLVGREKEYVSCFGPVKSWSHGILTPLHAVFGRVREKGKWKEQRYTLWQKEDVEGIHEDLVRRLFVQLRSKGDGEWDTYALAFEAALGVKSALKLSRQLLSVTQNSLSLWASHAQLERLRGRLDDARKVYHTIFVASSPPMQDGMVQIWWEWAEMEWLASRHEEVFNVILRSADIQERGDVAVLRAKRSLEVAFGCSTQWQERVAWIKLRALLELLTTANAKIATKIFDAHAVDEGSIEHESLTMASLLMLYYYSSILKNPMPPSLLRERARRATELYPSNSIVLGLFLEGEKGQGVWGNISASVGESGGKSKDVARRVEEVWIANWESGRWMDEIERTRSRLNAAVEHDRTRASPIIWRIFIEFEIRARDLRRAKKVLYRAIGECPLVKDLYLMAFGPLRSVFSSQELISLADSMAERGIRIRHALDEILEGWMMGKVDGTQKEEDHALDEIEENAQELRRLMPY